MKRRYFIKTTSASALFLGSPSLGYSLFSDKPRKHITILHTNDVHSHIDPFELNAGEKANKGGVARRAAVINKIREENPNTLLLDAGDIFQGTPYFNFYGGALELKLMSLMKYDAGTIGNHEFDNGIDGLLAPLHHAKFDLINSNYDFSNTVMNGHTKPYQIFEKGGVKIGVFGLGVQLEGLVTKSAYKETVYLDPIEIAQDMSKLLKHEKHCDLVICLSHLGYEYTKTDQVSDVKIAQNTKDIDLIIGGHTHTFLEKPTEIENAIGKTVLVNQVGCHGLYLGRVDFYLEETQKNNGESLSI